jgi:multiple sugar transport system substrate-binding protein
MAGITRRGTFGLAAAAALGARAARAAIPVSSTATLKLDLEKGASLRVLRPTKFVGPDEDVFRANSKAFTDATGIPVHLDFAGWEDLRPQTAVSANTGAGPDIVVGWGDDPHLYADKVLDLTELAEYLGHKYGGWYPLSERFGKRHGTNNWIAIPMGGSGGPAVYRESWVKQAGFDGIPSDLGQFLTLCQKLQQIGHPSGFALGQAVGDGNAYCSWLTWSHNAFMTDEAGKVTINSPETIAALKYSRELYQTFIPGTLSWTDPSNNKALTAGDIALTQNGVSLYFSIKNAEDPKIHAMAADLNHARMPFGLAGKQCENALVLNAMVFKHSKYPNAARDYIRFMMEVEQYDKWLTGCLGYWAQPLKAYAESDVWKSDPKVLAYRDTMAVDYWPGCRGPISTASGAVTSDYVLVNMYAAVASGQASPEDAAREAERRAKRYYDRA